MAEDHKSEKSRGDRLAIAAFVVAFLTLLATLYGIKTQLDALNAQLIQQAKLSSAQYILSLGDRLNSSKYTNLLNAIENHPHTYSPLKAGFTASHLEDYMGQFETLGDLVRDKVIDFRMAYDEFSYDAEKIYCNQDVQTSIASDRQKSGTATGTDAFWSGFQELATSFLNKDRYQCSDLDNQ